jgi:nucleoid-associated protein YgaU
MDEQRDIRQKETIRSVVDEFMAQKSSSHKPSGEISKELNSIVDEFYTQKSVPKELDSIVNDFYTQQTPHNSEKRIVTIKQGDTLGSISKRFYGSHMKFQKIIDGNHNLTNDFSTLSIGQKINVPY